ncbi:calcium-transporting ATPase [Aureococcus anophagefferens]|nr:calcium-transporting ATPase [Aureococcus anophagefferens]
MVEMHDIKVKPEVVKDYTEEQLSEPHGVAKPFMLEAVVSTMTELIVDKGPEDPELVKERHRHRFDGKAAVKLAGHKTETLTTFKTMEMSDLQVHEVPLPLLAADMKSDLKAGLSATAAADKLAEDGLNVLESPPKVTFLMLFLIQLTQFIIALLLGACVVSAAINATNKDRRGNPLAYVDSIAIFIIVMLNAVIAASTEGVNEMLLTGESEDVSKTDKVKKKAPGAAEKLTADTMIFSSCTVKAGNCKAMVVRTGMRTRVGQIAALLAGDGAKQEGCLPDTSANQTPLQVSLGKLSVQIGVLAIGCCLLVFVMGLALGVKDPTGASPGWLYMILISVTLTVAAIPEGLPLTVTISLSTGCSEMVKENVLMRKIAAVETLGSASVICTDKTGTLTEGKMRCVKMFVASTDYDVTGKGFDPTVGSVGAAGAAVAADMSFDGADDRKDDPKVKLLLTSALCCSSTTLTKESEGGEEQWTPKGNSSEAPIVVCAAKCGLWAKDLEPKFPLVTEIPFSSSRKMMIKVTKNECGELAGVEKAVGLDANYVAHIKGAPNYILKGCDKILRPDGSVTPVTEEDKDALLLAKVDELSSMALRVLAIALKPLESLPYDQDAEIEDKFAAIVKNITFVGLVASIDPERAGVKAAIEVAANASIRTVMITGDYLKTAAAIAKNIAILPEDGSLDKTGAVDCNDLRPGDDYLSNPDMDALTARVNVFARAKPEDKLEIVKSLQRQGLVSAMTGDGVNDAPALKEADIGVSMGLEGTEVAKGASDMILTDDNFCSIVKAVEKGRGIYSGIQKFVSFIMSVHFAEVVQIFLCVVSGLPIMRVPLQILFLVLVTDLPPAIALGVEPGEPGIMNKTPRPKTQPVVMPWMWRCIVANGLIMTAGITATYLVALRAYAGTYIQDQITDGDRNHCDVWGRDGAFGSQKWYDDPDDDNLKECTKFAIRKARTVAFIALVWAENLRAYSARSFTKPIWNNMFSNPTMNKAVFLGQICLYCGLFLPGLSSGVLDLHPLPRAGHDGIQAYGWGIAVCGALSCLLGCELDKFAMSFNPPNV